MITTGIHIPEAVLKRLATAVAAIHRETADMTIAEWRKAYRERHGPTLGCHVRVYFTKTGAVKSLHARPIDKSAEKFGQHGFETDVPLLGRASCAAKEIQKDCAEFLLRHEISQRRRAGLRELVGLTDDDLSAAAKELAPLTSWFSRNGPHCGSLSEQLRLRLIEDEVELRGNESNHQMLAAMTKNADYIAACRRQVEAECLAARKWRQAEEAGGYRFNINRDFEKRADQDQTVIAYRDSLGW